MLKRELLLCGGMERFPKCVYFNYFMELLQNCYEKIANFRDASNENEIYNLVTCIEKKEKWHSSQCVMSIVRWSFTSDIQHTGGASGKISTYDLFDR